MQVWDQIHLETKSKGIQTHRDFSNNATPVSPCHTQWYIWTLRWQRRDSSNGIEEKDGGSQKAVESTRGTTASIRVVLSEAAGWLVTEGSTILIPGLPLSLKTSSWWNSHTLFPFSTYTHPPDPIFSEEQFCFLKTN